MKLSWAGRRTGCVRVGAVPVLATLWVAGPVVTVAVAVAVAGPVAGQSVLSWSSSTLEAKEAPTLPVWPTLALLLLSTRTRLHWCQSALQSRPVSSRSATGAMVAVAVVAVVAVHCMAMV